MWFTFDLTCDARSRKVVNQPKDPGKSGISDLGNKSRGDAAGSLQCVGRLPAWWLSQQGTNSYENQITDR